MTAYVLAVDGGNTKTVAAVATLDGTIAGFGRSGCGDIYGAGSETVAVDHAFEAIHVALSTAGVPLAALSAAVFSMAGADWPEDFAFWENAAAQRGLRCPVRVMNDAIGGLRSGSPEGCGVSVIVGTGGAVGARSRSGLTWHGGFWAAAHTPGSHRIAEAGLKAVCQSELGMLPPTQLAARLVRLLDADGVERALWLLTSRGNRRILPHGDFVTEIFAAAREGDKVAARIVEEAGAELAAYALAAARRVNLGGDYPLVLAGGVLKNDCRLLIDAIVRRVRDQHPFVKPLTGVFEPVAGGVFWALEAAGAAVTPEVFARTYETLRSHVYG